MNARAVLATAVLAIVLPGCTTVSTSTGRSRAPVPTSRESVSPAPEGPGSAAAAARRLCEVPPPGAAGGSDVPREGPTPPVIAQVMRQVEDLRGFDYRRPVVAEPVTQQEIGRDLVEYTDAQYPRSQFDRRSLAWDTIGVVPDGTSLRDAYEAYGSSQVIGYYDTVSGVLRFVGTDAPSPLERITLAHELTHAIDDQRFGLERLDALISGCRDEDAAAALALVEGNATFFMLRWARTYLTVEEQVRVGVEAAAQETSTEGIPPFVLRLQSWPYDEGLRFVSALERGGGVDAIDDAFADPPTSTEQVIHPERYPNDAPTPMDVPDLAEQLGAGWRDLDVMSIGEAWLEIALALRLDASRASAAAAGWDGGTYRAWSNGDRVAVVLSTLWDSQRDASEFAAAIGAWIEQAGGAGRVLEPAGRSVTTLFANDPTTLRALQRAAA